MANNRMFIRCTECREEVGLFVYFPTPGWCDPYREMQEIADFLNDHAHDDEGTMEGPTNYMLVFEDGAAELKSDCYNTPDPKVWKPKGE